MTKKRRNRKAISKQIKQHSPQVSQIQAKQKDNQAILTYLRIPRTLLRLFLSLIAVAGFLFVVWPRISVYPGTSLNSHNPFQTPFIIKNDGYLPLYNIKYSLIAERMELVTGGTFINSGGSTGNTVDKLSPNKTSALFMNRIFAMPPNSVKYARVFIHVTYNPYPVPFTFTESVRFKTELRTNGEYVWFESYDKQ